MGKSRIAWKEPSWFKISADTKFKSVGTSTHFWCVIIIIRQPSNIGNLSVVLADKFGLLAVSTVLEILDQDAYILLSFLFAFLEIFSCEAKTSLCYSTELMFQENCFIIRLNGKRSISFFSIFLTCSIFIFFLEWKKHIARVHRNAHYNHDYEPWLILPWNHV